MLELQTPNEAAQWLSKRLSLRSGATLRADSRAVVSGDAFLAWPGRTHDARTHLAAALAGGAAACLLEAEGSEAALVGLADPTPDARVATLPGLKAVAGEIADLWYGQPSAKLDVLAVTGTNGKTSTAWWLAQALTHAGRRCGVVGTLGIGEPGELSDADSSLQSTGLTSPDALTLHAAFRQFADHGFAACALEASSIGLVDDRLAAAHIAVAIYTNFTRDHLDYHGDMVSYWAAKRRLFSWPGLRAAVVNIDDAQGAALAAELQCSALDLWTVSLNSSASAPAPAPAAARLQAHNLQHAAAGLAFDLVEGDTSLPVVTRLLGGYNVSNLLGVAAALRALGMSLAQVAAALPTVTSVPGRMQPVLPAGEADIAVLVDYAHTPDALEKALQALQPLARARGGRLLCVVGCGGNRDASKRPLMGAIAERQADVLVLTSDNPRFEDPALILQDIVAGLSNPAAAQLQTDRALAIAQTIAGAHAGDVVLLAGKGHEDYQDVTGVKQPFSDLAHARTALQMRMRMHPRPRSQHGVAA